MNLDLDSHKEKTSNSSKQRNINKYKHNEFHFQINLIFTNWNFRNFGCWIIKTKFIFNFIWIVTRSQLLNKASINYKSKFLIRIIVLLAYQVRRIRSYNRSQTARFEFFFEKEEQEQNNKNMICPNNLICLN